MSLEVSSPSPQQSAPPVALQEPTTLGSAAASKPAAPAQPQAAPPAANGAPAPAEAPRGLGDNGGPDWRAMLAGEDTKALERLARYNSPTDVTKALLEATNKLSQRPSLMTALPDDAKPEQVAEYRKAKGVPAEATLEAYGVKAPDGYDLNDGEKALLGEVVKDLHGKHYGPKEVNDVLGHYFKAQAATIQNQRKIAIDRQKEWTSAMQGELGRDYEPTIAAASSYLNNQFADKPEVRDELLMAQLPGGGRLGDHPAFIRMVADLAVRNGYTDRIEAASLESSGKSLVTQRDELMALNRTNPALYNDPQTQARIDKLNELLIKRGDVDDYGRPVARR